MLDYPMAVRSAQDIPQVRARLGQILGVVVPADGVLVQGALAARVVDVEHPVTTETYGDLLGTPATCRVLWSVENKLDEAAYQEGRRRMAVCATVLADQLDAEVCLTFQLDRVVMRRQGGVLDLLDWFPEWSDAEVLAQVPRPCRVVSDEGRL